MSKRVDYYHMKFNNRLNNKTPLTSCVQGKEETGINISKYRNISDKGLRCLFKALTFRFNVVIVDRFYVADVATSSDHPPSQI